jgi:putative transposase
MQATKCFKYRIEPTQEQEQRFLSFAGCRRYVWNWALSRKQEVYKTTGKSIGYNALAAELVSLKRQPDTVFLKECHSQVLQQVLMDLETAFKNFFEKRARFPKFKSRKRTSPAFRIPQNVSVVDGKVSVPKLGLVKARIHRPLEGTVKSATIKQEADGHWYVVFVAHIEIAELEPTTHSPVGIDVGLESFLTTDDGDKVKPPKFYRKAERKLKRLGRQFSRCQKQSRRRTKAKQRLARYHRRISNQRADFLHKLSHSFATRHDTICIEDLNLKGLVKTKLAKSFSDAALGSFVRMLDYKAIWHNSQIVRVGRFYPSSKTCHDCKNVQSLELSDRNWICLSCGVIHDRDTNAAKNILSEGLRILVAGMAKSQNASGGNVRLATASSSR